MKKQSFRVIFIIICDNWLSQLFLALIIKNLNYRLKLHFLEYFLLKAYFCRGLIRITMTLNYETATLYDR